MKGWMYILECSDGSYYTGSTHDLELRIQQHQNSEGANHTKKHLPVKLVYFEEFQRIDDALYREKQIQGWSRKKKEALINGNFESLPELSRNYTQFPPLMTSLGSPSTPSTGSGTVAESMDIRASASSATAASSAFGNATASDSTTVPELVEGAEGITELRSAPVPEPVEGAEGITELRSAPVPEPVEGTTQSMSTPVPELAEGPLLNNIHHTAIICSDYEKSKAFYVDILGLKIINETYREERQSYKLDLALNGIYVIELFSFPNPPQRVSRPEATGLRHLAFEVDDLERVINHLKVHNIECEPIRIDEITNKRFTFASDPDNLPIEFYEK